MNQPSDEAAIALPQNSPPDKVLLYSGLFLIVLGLASIALPWVTAIAIEMLIGIAFLLVGVAQGTYAAQTTKHENVILHSVFSILFLLCGLHMLFSPVQGVIALSLLLAFLFFVDGVGRLILAYRLPTHFNRIYPLIEGLAGVMLGLLFWLNWPGDAAWMIGLLVGLRLILAGLTFTIFGTTLKPPKVK